jgi:serine/threonine-protein kinase
MPYYQPGDILFDKYKIIKFLGAGTAEVYLAENLEIPGSQRALKLVHKNMAGISDAEFEQFGIRFQLEAERGDRIKHPNVMKTFDRITDQDQHILVMEYASGGSLREKIDQNTACNIDQVLEIGLDIASGL